jgi:hypothetical protein
MDLSLIREKITRGDLPRDDWNETRLIVGGFHSSCAACDGPTMPADIAFEGRHGAKRVVLHPDCYVMWEEARQPDR